MPDMGFELHCKGLDAFPGKVSRAFEHICVEHYCARNLDAGLLAVLEADLNVRLGD